MPFRGHLPPFPLNSVLPTHNTNVKSAYRYVSLSAVHRTVPFRNHATVSDTRIIQHYRQRLGDAWDGSYVIWVVPPEADGGPYPRQVLEEDGESWCGGVAVRGKKEEGLGILHVAYC